MVRVRVRSNLRETSPIAGFEPRQDLPRCNQSEYLPLRQTVRVRVRVRREFVNMSDLGIELGDGVCDFEKVPPDQLCPSAKRD